MEKSLCVQIGIVFDFGLLYEFLVAAKNITVRNVETFFFIMIRHNKVRFRCWSCSCACQCSKAEGQSPNNTSPIIRIITTST